MMARRATVGVTVQIINRRVYVAIHRPKEPVLRISVGRDTPENRRIAERSAEEIRHRMTVAALRGVGSRSTPTLAEFTPRHFEEDTGGSRTRHAAIAPAICAAPARSSGRSEINHSMRSRRMFCVLGGRRRLKPQGGPSDLDGIISTCSRR
jgi:hypothetical protein